MVSQHTRIPLRCAERTYDLAPNDFISLGEKGLEVELLLLVGKERVSECLDLRFRRVKL